MLKDSQDAGTASAVLKRGLAVVALICLPLPSLARTDCPPARVVHVQAEADWVLYSQEGAPWRSLGRVSDPGVKERLATLLAAQMANKRVMVGYASDTYDCSKTDYGSLALLVRTYAD